MKRLAILTTHPIQYHAAWFAALAAHAEIDLEVIFCHQATSQEQAAAGFGVSFDWDVSLVDGYPHRFLNNVAERPSVSKFRGIDTPGIDGIIAGEKWDAVMVNGWHYKSAWQAMRACWRTKTPLMARGDSHLHDRRPAFKRALKWPFYRWVIPRLDACLAAGKWSREYYLHYGARPERIFLAPHAVNDTYFGERAARLSAQRTELRTQWKLDPTAVVYLFAGKFIDVKRPIDFIAGINAASAGRPLMGLMVGDGPLRRECEEFVSRNKVPIRFAGFLNQSEIAAAYIASDALVLPSEGETWGLAVNEAMACGRPCFVSDQVGCGPDMIVHDETGALFPMGDREALAMLLANYAANPTRLISMGEAARRKAREHTVAVAVDGVLQALAAVK